MRTQSIDKTICVLPGDGIGPEITEQAVKVLRAVAGLFGHGFHFVYADFGAGAYFKHGNPFPDATKEACDDADVILKGPIGLPVDEISTIPADKRPEGAVLSLRKRYDTYANLRPVTVTPSFFRYSPLKESVFTGAIDILMIRELVGGIYFGSRTEGEETMFQYAEDNCTYNRDQVERIVRYAFNAAREKGVRLTHIHKANVLATSRYWNRIIDEVKKDYPDVECVSMLVDNAAFQMVKDPCRFNGIVLTENMLGDILSDQMGALPGSLGFMASLSLGPEKSYAEPAHGSACDIAGKNIANPFSMIGSAALVLEKVFGLETEARLVREAMDGIYRDGHVTHDIAEYADENATSLSTAEFGDLTVRNLEKIA
ncbi:MAG: 3-isopropylmalate dehydrogenase [Spirochaetales bacterium]|nr:3-isopropylmalate dehydrogenase [Spirochaetales bacterium]